MWFLDQDGYEVQRRTSLDEDWRPQAHHESRVKMPSDDLDEIEHTIYDEVQTKEPAYLSNWTEGRDDDPHLPFSEQKARAERTHNRLAYHSLKRNGATHINRTHNEATYDADMMLVEDIWDL